MWICQAFQDWRGSPWKRPLQLLKQLLQPLLQVRMHLVRYTFCSRACFFCLPYCEAACPRAPRRQGSEQAMYALAATSMLKATALSLTTAQAWFRSLLDLQWNHAVYRPPHFHCTPIHLWWDCCPLSPLAAGLLQVVDGLQKSGSESVLVGMRRRGWVLPGRGEEEEGRGQAAGGCRCQEARRQGICPGASQVRTYAH